MYIFKRSLQVPDCKQTVEMCGQPQGDSSEKLVWAPPASESSSSSLEYSCTLIRCSWPSETGTSSKGPASSWGVWSLCSCAGPSWACSWKPMDSLASSRLSSTPTSVFPSPLNDGAHVQSQTLPRGFFPVVFGFLGNASDIPFLSALFRRLQGTSSMV
ncbi:vesicle transport protein GOT1A isoform X10 [Prionailurus viverrinus]|uniref:vesicle transport protein GOT1A isoform X10 n=1 Tax=Prionailurus viverrinus TaxID=61388 RepID=UPI001FF10629|nr:vesicle transport protein GOT1A isoform X10 [Prionailurus viverrinus]